jgi:glycosyltransferase involved in cell wall biosynthesis
LKFSLITVVYNRVSTIEQTIRSVLDQSYSNIEYIVVDGGSTDGTLDIIRKYESKISRIISEKDNGVYDAINKGIQNATGEIVGILHADDRFAHKNVISQIAEIFHSNPDKDCLFGDVGFVRSREPNKIVRYYSSSIFHPGRFQIGIMPAHPTFYCYKKYFEQYGLYRTDLDISADFDLLLRFIYKHQLRYIYLPQIMVLMNLGGKSTNGIRSTLKINKENRKVLREHGIPSSYLHLYSRYFIKIGEILRPRRKNKE